MTSPTISHCPSFDVSVSDLPYSLRLPNYRSSHLGRFHPYGGRPFKSGPQGLLAPVNHQDLDFDLQSIYTQPAAILSAFHQEDEDVVSLRSVVQEMEGHHAVFRGRICLFDLIIDFTLAIRRQSARQKGSDIDNVAKPQDLE
ncbi:hypothetical protein BJ138DRAFT_184920 [Hygrophoropsis aurantiaca]|uniref:Uncharacterized protein n=1 Tax=Hygrophoropsis aurantiaca TaxID=72124 RepID=A0ACB8A9L1_9AGAM|nr:hypothetical protein BJ138DRAFT_184920 [Hygrophoropsis aurantiaca]